MFRVLLWSSALLFLVVRGDVVTFDVCENSDNAGCKITELRVDPCKEAKSRKPCRFRSGSNASIEFDYVADFDSDDLVTQAYSATLVDLPLIGMDRDGCKFTQCPTKRGENASYKNTLFISPAFPLLTYTVKWRLWDKNDESNDCCFKFKIKLIK